MIKLPLTPSEIEKLMLSANFTSGQAMFVRSITEEITGNKFQVRLEEKEKVMKVVPDYSDYDIHADEKKKRFDDQFYDFVFEQHNPAYIELKKRFNLEIPK